jgi:WXG100 family type VII secretion target
MAITQELSFGSVTLKVTPEVLHTKAEVVNTKVSSMTKEFGKMNTLIARSNSYWVGKAGEVHRKTYQEKQPDIEEIFKRLSEHVTELHQMATVYMNAEKTIKEVAEALPNDIII